MRAGKLLRKTYGRLPKFRSKPREIDIKVKYLKPERQVSLDQAIKNNQKAIAQKKALQQKKRAMQIAKLKKAISRLS